MAVFPSQLTRSWTRPASREARCRAAVKPRPTGMSPYAPARLRRAVRLGALPLAPDVEAGQGTLELGFGNAELLVAAVEGAQALLRFRPRPLQQKQREF